MLWNSAVIFLFVLLFMIRQIFSFLFLTFGFHS